MTLIDCCLCGLKSSRRGHGLQLGSQAGMFVGQDIIQERKAVGIPGVSPDGPAKWSMVKDSLHQGDQAVVWLHSCVFNHEYVYHLKTAWVTLSNLVRMLTWLFA